MAFAVGSTVFCMAKSVSIHADVLGVALAAPSADFVPASRQQNLLTVSCYHFSAYVTATVVAIGMTYRIARRRAAP
jgi:hypothetical protein